MTHSNFYMPPFDFNPDIHVVATYVTCKDDVLFLKLSPRKGEAGKWGIPAGKMDKDEDPLEAAKRELFEETGLSGNLTYHGELYMRKPSVDYVYKSYSIDFDSRPVITLSDEHVDLTWISYNNVKTLPLMDGAEFAFDHFLSLQLTEKEK